MIDWLTDLKQARQAPPADTLVDDDLRECQAVSLALLNSAAALIDVSDEEGLLRALCANIVASTPHIRLAWAWVGEPNTETIRPQIVIGPAKAYVETLEIQRNWLTMRGPAFRALVNGKPDIHSITRLGRLLFKPWNGPDGYDFQIAAALPILMPEENRRGLVVFYADDEVRFHKIGLEPFKASVRLAEAGLRKLALGHRLMIQAMTDPLTGLLNRRASSEVLAQEISRVRRQGGTFSVLICDFDHFKHINDTWGHAAGDATLVATTQLIRKSLRQEDKFARLGGEEFLCILPQTEQAAAIAVAEKLRLAVESTPVSVQGREFPLTASFGVATYIPSDGEPDEGVRHLMARADAALYVSKTNGRNRVSA